MYKFQKGDAIAMKEYTNHMLALFSDDTSSLSNLVELLENSGFDTISGTLGDRFIFYTSEDIPDLIILDINNYNSNYYSIFKEISKSKILKNIPVILLYSSDLQSNILDFYNAGFYDFISKPFHNMELLERIKLHIDLESSKKQLKIKSQLLDNTLIELEHAKNTIVMQNKKLEEFKSASDIKETKDILTNLYSRPFMLKRIEDEMSRFDRKSIQFSIIAVEIQDFQKLKSKYSDIEIDTLIKDFSLILNSLKRQGDLLGRWSDNRFLFLLKDTNGNEASTSHSRIVSSLKDEISSYEEDFIHFKVNSSYLTYNQILPISIFCKLIDDSLVKSSVSNV